MNSPKKLPIYLSIISIVLVCLVIFNLKQDTSINPTLDAKVTALAPTEKTVKKQQLPVPTQDKRILPRTLVSNTYPNKVTNPGAIVLNESNASHSLLSFNLPSFSIQEVTTKSGQIFTQVTSERGAKNLNRKGYPALPRYKQQLLVPKDCAIELITNKLAYTTHTIGTLLPGSGPISRSQKRPEPTCGDFYNSQESYPKAPIFISDSFEFRNMRAITITINPFIFDAATQSLRIYNKLDFEIRTSGGKLLLENPPAVADFQTRASESFINYPQATQEYTTVTTRALPEPKPGNILIVYASQFKDSLGAFVLWKRKIGFNVETAEYPTATGSGVQALKSFIDQKPEVSHIILIGDSEDIPARAYNWDFTKVTDEYDASFSPLTTRIHYTDRYYAGVIPSIDDKASDLIADKFISRISSSNVPTVENQLTRIIDYESGKYLNTNSHWLESILLVASSDGKNISDFGQADYEQFNDIETELIANSHYQDSQKLYANDGDADTPLATKDAVVQELELGKGLTYYLGHGYNYKWVTSGFDSTAAQSLVTNHKPSLVIEPVCNNGLFYAASQCLAENQMEGEGAIGVLASPSETFWDPPILLLEDMTDSIIGDKFVTAGGLISSATDSAVLWSADNDTVKAKKATAVQMLYFGDCSMAIRTRIPKEITLTTPETLNATVHGIEIDTEPQSKVSLTHNGIIIDRTTTNQDGKAILKLNSPNFINYTVSTWKRNSLGISKIITRDHTLEVDRSSSNTGALINLGALFDGTLSLADHSNFRITDGKLYYKVGATRTAQDSVILEWTSVSGNTQQITINLGLTESSETTHSLMLKSGWNLVGSPITSKLPLDLTTVATRSEPAVDLTIWGWDQSQGTYSRPGVNDVLEEQHAFWLHTSKESTTHTFSGSSTKGLMTDLSLGWNLYSPVKEMPAPLGALSIWKWDTISKNYKPILAVDNLIPLTGYWIFMNQ